MKELKLVVSESDSASLVLALASADVDSPSDSASQTNSGSPANSTSPSDSVSPSNSSLSNSTSPSDTASQTNSGSPSDSVSPSNSSLSNSASSGNDASPQEHTEDFFLPVTDQLRELILGSSTAASKDNSNTTNPTDNPSTESSSESNGATSTSPTPSPTTEDSSATVTALSGAASVSSPDARATREPSRPRRTHLSIRPREIQDRIRQGASIAELAEEADTDESTIEPYAWPILQERALVAENAHSAYPFVDAEGGPSKQTLWEVLATALAARGESLNDCEWDAYQDASKRWFVTVSWNKAAAGQTASHVAEFSFDRHQMEPRVIEPHNSLAADLVDPRYGRPVRTISAVTPLISDTQADRDDEFDHAAHLDEPGPVPHPRGHFTEQDAETTQNLRAIRGGDEAGASQADESDSEPLLQNPPAEGKPKRRRKAVTPHWEDVLLGVRTNPKKK